LDTQLGSAFDRVFKLLQVARESNLEGTSTRNNGFVFDGIFDGTETITDGVVNLGNGVRIGSYSLQLSPKIIPCEFKSYHSAAKSQIWV
jgi:hypothetical protein